MENEVQVNNNMHNDADVADSRVNYFTYIRGSLFIISLIGIFLNTIYGFALPHGNIECLVDQSFEYTKGINDYFKHHLGMKHALMILSSILLDFIVVYMAVIWVLRGKSWRLYTALFIFFTFRYCVQVIYNCFPYI